MKTLGISRGPGLKLLHDFRVDYSCSNFRVGGDCGVYGFVVIVDTLFVRSFLLFDIIEVETAVAGVFGK